MASRNDFLKLLDSSDFKLLVAQIIAVVAKSQENGANANVVCDALLYVNALIYEASPFYEGPNGLRDAQTQISADAASMLALIRDASLRQGQPKLHTIAERETID